MEASRIDLPGVGMPSRRPLLPPTGRWGCTARILDWLADLRFRQQA
jgi:hypothetical protein